MRKYKQTTLGSDVYKLIREAPMTDIERQVALNAMRNADTIVNAMFWVKEKLAAVGQFFLKPSWRH